MRLMVGVTAYRFVVQRQLETQSDVSPHFDGVDLEAIEEIYLAYNTFGVGAAEALGTNLSKMKSLKVAGLSDIFGTRTIEEIPQALTSICTGLRSCPQLVELNLSGNAFGARVVQPLVPLLTHHRSLQIIKIYDNGFGPEAGATVAKALIKSARRSREEGVPSNLRKNEAPPARRGWEYLIDVLESTPELEFLDLSDCVLPQPAVALTGVLAAGKVPRLRTLLLENNDIEKESYGALSDAVLAHLPALHTSV
ncbi:hypothetical protein BD311DRAFT_789495 [Dichomitus squalens]|uniref:RNI-like protein n=1 Tax=Dichomitus squalens TaxID=114155 RepID=A0A4Q9MJ27_9APHY|nr:hypothetical protein BD311DRAFT_789495 [Dichomitus squalens]